MGNDGGMSGGDSGLRKEEMDELVVDIVSNQLRIGFGCVKTLDTKQF